MKPLEAQRVTLPKAAYRIVGAIKTQQAGTLIGFQERMLMRLNTHFPPLIDHGLAKQPSQALRHFTAPSI
jgi:hypothetical protein